jgi:uncharacterized protein (DUF362 family)
MAKQKEQNSGTPGDVKPEVVEAVVERARDQGVSRETAEDIVREAAAEGVAPEKLEEVAEEAIQVEREDLEKAEGSDQSDLAARTEPSRTEPPRK